jgi:peroxisomal 2,4-dienoyl-CoA reductase
MEIDAVGTFTMSKAAFGALSEAKGAVIINISATLHYGATWYQARSCSGGRGCCGGACLGVGERWRVGDGCGGASFA